MPSVVNSANYIDSTGTATSHDVTLPNWLDGAIDDPRVPPDGWLKN